MRCTPHLGARLVGHVVGSCIMVAPAYASDTSGLDFQQFVEEFAGKKDFFVALASATRDTALAVAGTAVAVAQLDQAKRSADEAKRSADEAKRSADEACDSPSEVPIGQIGCASTWELMTKGCSKRSCAERARSSRTFPTTSPSFQSFFLKSLVQPPRDWLDKICFSVVYRCCSAFCPSPFVFVPLAEAST